MGGVLLSTPPPISDPILYNPYLECKKRHFYPIAHVKIKL